jgi:hypothetical protein
MAKKSKKEYLQELIDNINGDRQATIQLLQDVSHSLVTQQPGLKIESYQSAGAVAGKYLEVLQKINEQMSKALNMLKEKEGPVDENEELELLGLSIDGPKGMENLYKNFEKKDKN